MVCEKSKVAHPEAILHLLLEPTDVGVDCPSDEKIVNVHSHHQWSACYSPCVHGMLVVALHEPELVER
jgi:hypothetical protein